MAGLRPVNGAYTLQQLIDALNATENEEFVRLTAIHPDPTQARNLANFVNDESALTPIGVTAEAAPAGATVIAQGKLYIEGKLTQATVYRAAS